MGAAKSKTTKRKYLIPVLFIVLTVILFREVFAIRKVEGRSMQPLINPGDRVLIIKYHDQLNPIKSGDIFYISSKEVYRVLAIPGNTIKISEGDISINGKLIQHKAMPIMNHGPAEIPENYIYFYGENVSVSGFGYIESNKLLGKILLVLP